MILHNIDSDDYLYLKLEMESTLYPWHFSHLKKNTMLRFKIKDLRRNLWRQNVINNSDCFEFELNPTAGAEEYIHQNYIKE